ncbi:MAG: hypothetical protein FWC96_08260 [Oscillospiraceae bacterium]|nr:hypothetical protein [Oscillospiraceae bacterium]
MRNTSKEKQLLKDIQQNYSVIRINNTSHNIEHIINNMTVMEPEPPDFICGENIYLEHFEVTAYQRVKNKNNKLSSVHLADEAQLTKRVSNPQCVFRTTHYRTPPTRTNTFYLKENIDALISAKTQEQEKYDQKRPNAKDKHLLIELKSRCEILLGRDGQYLDGSEIEDERQHDRRELYEVYRDADFVKSLKEKYLTKWDLLLFFDESYSHGTHTFYLYCFDLKEDIVAKNMKYYPDTLTQIIHGELEIVKMQGGGAVTNIRYDIETDCYDNSRSVIWDCNADTIVVNSISLHKSSHDSIYMTSDKGLWFETSQLAFAINPDVSDDIMVKYIPLLLKDILFIECQKVSIKLRRNTFLGTYFYSNGTDALYRIDEKRSLSLKLGS